MRKTFRLQPDAQILPGTVFRHRTAVDWFKLKAGDQCATRGFRNDAEGARAFPAAVFAGVLVINLGFPMNKDVSQYAIGFAPRVQHFLARVEHFVQRRQQMCPDDVVLLRLNLEAGVLLRDFFYRRQQRR